MKEIDMNGEIATKELKIRELWMSVKDHTDGNDYNKVRITSNAIRTLRKEIESLKKRLFI